MEQNMALVIKMMRELKTRAVVNAFPRSKDKKLSFSLPEYIEGLTLSKHLCLYHDLTPIEQTFVIDNLRNCPAVQPGDTFIQVGTTGDETPVIVKDYQYGEFRIIGKRRLNCFDPKDVNTTLTSYICAYGVTAFVHKHRVGRQYVTSVYYSKDIDNLLRYIKMRTTDGLYNSYLSDGIRQYDNGEYYESFKRKA